MTDASASSSRSTLLGRVLGVVLLVAVLAGVWLWLRPEPSSTSSPGVASAPGTDVVARRALLGEVLSQRDRAPIAHAVVTVQLDDGSTRTTATDDAGTFAIEALSSSITRLTLTAPGFATRTRAGASLASLPAEAALTELLEPVSSTSPHATDAHQLVVQCESHPVPDAIAVVLRADASGRSQLETVGHTDDSGVLPLDSAHDAAGHEMPRDDVTVLHPLHGIVRHVSLGDGETRVDMPASGTLVVDAVDAQGHALSGVQVQVEPELNARDDDAALHMLRLLMKNRAPTQGESGPVEVEVPSVPLWVHVLAHDVTNETAPAEPQRVTVAPHARVPLHVVLGPRLGISGVVRDVVTHAPIAHAQVMPEGLGPEAIKVFTDESGRYELKKLPARPTGITAMAPGHRRVTQGLSGDGAQLTLDLELTPDDGTPGSEVVGIGVVIAPDSRGARVQQVVEGGPSEGKIHVGDIIVRVEQLELAYRPFRDAMGALRGSVGSRVNVTVVRESGAEDTLQIERARVRVPPPSAPPSAPSTSTKP